MLCQEFEAVLEQTSDQPIPAEAAAHAAQCGNCRSLAADLESIAAAARELTVPLDEPPSRIWIRLRAQLEEEGIIRPEAIVPAGFAEDDTEKQSWLARLGAWMRRPALVATYAAFMVLAAGIAWEHSKTDPGTVTEPSVIAEQNTHESLNRLEAQTTNDLQTLNPEANAALQRDLKIVDDFIAVCEKALHDEPRDDSARQYLYGAYQQKSELLTAAMQHGRTGE